MSLEPQRPIEDLVREHARRRREQTGGAFELHPATRKMLQDEVRKAHPKAQRSEGFLLSLIGRLGPKLSWAVAAGAVAIGLGLLVLLPLNRNQPETTAAFSTDQAPVMEMVDVSRLAETNLTLVAQTAPPRLEKRDEAVGGGARQFQQPVNLQFGELTNTTLLALEERKDAPTGAAASLSVANSGKAEKKPAEVDKNADLSDSLRATEPAAVTAAAAPAQEDAFRRRFQPEALDRLAGAPALKQVDLEAELQKEANSKQTQVAQANLYDNQSSELDLDFAQVPAPVRTKVTAAKDKKSAPAAVLTTFKLQQTGNNVKVVDHDGSVYTGTVERFSAAPASSSSSLRAAPVENYAVSKAAAPAQNEQNIGGLAFRVTGTNRSLNQRVIFAGNITGVDDVQAQQQTNALTPAQNSPLGQNSVNNQTVYNQNLARRQLNSVNRAQLTGTAQVGDRTQVQINAVPTNR